MTSWPTRIGCFVLAGAVPVLFTLIPTGAFLAHSFWRVENQALIREASLTNYVGFLTSATYLSVFAQTLLLCLETTLVCLLIGYPVAVFIWRRRGRARYVLLLLFVTPLFMSYIVKIYTMRAILGLNGFLNQLLVGAGILEKPSLVFLYNQTSILLTMAVIFLPFVVLPVFLSLERIPRALLAASADLGAGGWRTFRHVTLPLSAPGTVAGCLFAFVLALGDFVTPQMVGGPSGFTFGRVIWSQFGLAYNWPFGAALAAVLLGVALLVIAGAARATGAQRI